MISDQMHIAFTFVCPSNFLGIDATFPTRKVSIKPRVVQPPWPRASASGSGRPRACLGQLAERWVTQLYGTCQLARPLPRKFSRQAKLSQCKPVTGRSSSRALQAVSTPMHNLVAPYSTTALLAGIKLLGTDSLPLTV